MTALIHSGDRLSLCRSELRWHRKDLTAVSPLKRFPKLWRCVMGPGRFPWSRVPTERGAPAGRGLIPPFSSC